MERDKFDCNTLDSIFLFQNMKNEEMSTTVVMNLVSVYTGSVFLWRSFDFGPVLHN